VRHNSAVPLFSGTRISKVQLPTMYNRRGVYREFKMAEGLRGLLRNACFSCYMQERKTILSRAIVTLLRSSSATVQQFLCVGL